MAGVDAKLGQIPTGVITATLGALTVKGTHAGMGQEGLKTHIGEETRSLSIQAGAGVCRRVKHCRKLYILPRLLNIPQPSQFL